jgi:diguanylate cyclase (GGDEF)-like protein/PAS domain S-box-containing protein
MAVAADRRKLSGERRRVLSIAVLYAGLLGIWILLQSGIPFAMVLDLELPAATTQQAASGWFFAASSAWLLYLLVSGTLAAVRRAEEAIRLRDRAIEASVNAVIITDCAHPANPIVYVNPAFQRITGYAGSEALGRNPEFLLGEDRDQPEMENIRAALREQRPGHAVLRNYRKDGRMYWNELHVAPVRDEDGAVTHFVGVQNDITQAREYQEALAHQANHDALTGLPNRNLLRDRIVQAIAYAGRYGHFVAVAHLNLDRFREINESLGDAAGDRLLHAVGERLGTCIRAADTAARVGGDQFALVLHDQASREFVAGQIGRVAAAVSQPFSLDGRDLYLTCSTGVALFPADGRDPETLMKNAQSAMYRAREKGPGQYRFYDPDMNARADERLALANHLRRALDAGEFRLHYQPQVELKTGRVAGAEALLRWSNRELGEVSPARFIPLAEETGLIIPISEWTLRRACAQNRVWRERGLPPIDVAVNLSALQFRRGDVAEQTAAILRESGLEPGALELEITESAIMHDVDEAVAMLGRLNDMGVQVSIDDFGTGYSSLSYLKRFPVRRLKIDQSFVRHLDTDPGDAAIVEAVISLGHSLKLQVLAEGVETAAQVEFLRRKACDLIQGYVFSGPLAAEEFSRLLESGRTLGTA